MKARENPFAVERVEAIRYRPLKTTFAEIFDDLPKRHYRAAIVGPEGSGKTTLLEDLGKALAEKRYSTRTVFVNDSSPMNVRTCRRFLAELAADEIVLLDGADALPRWGWSLIKNRTLGRAAGLIITTHRLGMLPTLVECSTSLALLQSLVGELQPPNRPVPTDTLEALYRRHAGNLRDCLRELYDLYAQGIVPM